MGNVIWSLVSVFFSTTTPPRTTSTTNGTTPPPHSLLRGRSARTRVRCSQVWLIILVFIGWPVACIVAPFFILLSPCVACISACSSIVEVRLRTQSLNRSTRSGTRLNGWLCKFNWNLTNTHKMPPKMSCWRSLRKHVFCETILVIFCAPPAPICVPNLVGFSKGGPRIRYGRDVGEHMYGAPSASRKRNLNKLHCSNLFIGRTNDYF